MQSSQKRVMGEDDVFCDELRVFSLASFLKMNRDGHKNSLP